VLDDDNDGRRKVRPPPPVGAAVAEVRETAGVGVDDCGVAANRVRLYFIPYLRMSNLFPFEFGVWKRKFGHITFQVIVTRSDIPYGTISTPSR